MRKLYIKEVCNMLLKFLYYWFLKKNKFT